MQIFKLLFIKKSEIFFIPSSFYTKEKNQRIDKAKKNYNFLNRYRKKNLS